MAGTAGSGYSSETSKEGVGLQDPRRKIVSKEWGLAPEQVLWIYTAIIRPKISCGALV